MKITITPIYAEEPKYSFANFEELAEGALDGSDYETGRLEAAQQTANNSVAVIGRLIDLLVEKAVITPREGLTVLTQGYYDRINISDSKIEFLP